MNVDVVCYKDGNHGDNSAMILLGDVHQDIRDLCEKTRIAMYKAIEICKPGAKFTEIGEIIEDYAHDNGLFVNHDFRGHGVSHHLLIACHPGAPA